MGTSTFPQRTGIASNDLSYEITDTAISDHGDASIVGSIAWAVKEINQSSTRKGTIHLGAGTFTCNTKIDIQDNISLIGAGVGVTVLDFNDNNGGIEISNGDIYTASNTWSVGDYAIPGNSAWPHAVRFRCTTGGTGGTVAAFDTLALANTDAGDTFAEAGGVAWEAVANVTPYLGEVSYDMVTTMTGEGLRASRCNGVNFGTLRATGGNASSPNVALQIDSCNQFGLGKLIAEVDCNGVFINIGNDTVLPYNFGDGYIENLDVTLAGASTYGIKFEGSDTTTDTINNVLVNRAEIIGSGEVADCQIAVWFHGAQRNTIKHLDCELINVAVMETGTATVRSTDNYVSQMHMINSGAQATEQYEWARGVPFGQNCTTPYTTVNVRDAWLNYTEFSALDSITTAYIADNDGTWGRNVTVVGTPSGGYTPLTISSAIPASGRDSLARHPVLTINTKHAIQSGMVAGSGALAGITRLVGRALAWSVNSTDNYIYPVLYQVSAGIIDLRAEENTAGSVKFHTSGGVTLVPLSSAPADAVPGMLASSDGTGSGFDGSSGAGLYVRNAADTAWVFIG